MKKLLFALFLPVLSSFGAGLVNPPLSSYNATKTLTIVNASTYGAVPFVTNDWSARTIPANIADSTASIQAAIYASTNSSGYVYIPYGVYKLTQTLDIPVGVTIHGDGWLHGGGNGGTTMTSPFTLLWQSDLTKDGLYFHRLGGFGGIYNIEVCGATNPIAPCTAAGSDATDIGNLPSSKLAVRGIVMESVNNQCFEMDNVSVCGFHVGVDSAGNQQRYSMCSWNGNDIGWQSTNAPIACDQMVFTSCGAGMRKGGICYVFNFCKGVVFNSPCDIKYYAWASIWNSLITINGGNSEQNQSDSPTWSYGAVNASGYASLYYTNIWRWGDGQILLPDYGIGENASTLNINGWSLNGANTHPTVIAGEGNNSLTLNTAGFSPQQGTIQDGGSYRFVSGFSKLYFNKHGGSAGSANYPVSFTWPDGANTYFRDNISEGTSLVAPQQDPFFYATLYGGISSGSGDGNVVASTNFTLNTQGVFKMTRENPSAVSVVRSVGYNSTGLPKLLGSRVLLSDPGNYYDNGRLNTNYTVMDLKVKGVFSQDIKPYHYSISADQVWHTSGGDGQAGNWTHEQETWNTAYVYDLLFYDNAQVSYSVPSDCVNGKTNIILGLTLLTTNTANITFAGTLDGITNTGPVNAWPNKMPTITFSSTITPAAGTNLTTYYITNPITSLPVRATRFYFNSTSTGGKYVRWYEMSLDSQ